MKKTFGRSSAAGPTNSVVVSTARVLDRKHAVDDVIARRAYEFFETAGREDGHSLDHWLRAESEILSAVPLEISEAPQEVLVRAEVPGFSADDLAIAIEPGRLLISGRKDATIQEAAAGDPAGRCGDQFFCTADLPRAVDSAGVRAWLDEGMLRVVLPTVPPPPDARHEQAMAR